MKISTPQILIRKLVYITHNKYELCLANKNN